MRGFSLEKDSESRKRGLRSNFVMIFALLHLPDYPQIRIHFSRQLKKEQKELRKLAVYLIIPPQN